MATEQEKLAIATSFILDSPPGEVNDVFNDLRVLIGNDELLQDIPPAFEQYNREQFATVSVPGKDYKVVLSDYNRLEANKYLDPRSNTSLTVDPLLQNVKETEDYAVSESEGSQLRAAVESAALNYTSDHYPDGVCTVNLVENSIVITIVDDKFNPDNFWSGKWRSLWTIPIGSSEIKGTVRTLVHYYEDGNVQLNSSREFTAAVGQVDNPEAFATAALKSISKLEADYQNGLNETYTRLPETTFKSLRRALPVTRSKIEWQSIAGYKLGSELSTR